MPIDSEVDRERMGWHAANHPARLRIVADAYGLDSGESAGLLTAIDDALDRVESAVRRGVDAGDPGTVALWNRTGRAARFDRRRRWWAAHRDRFTVALG